MKEAVAVGKYTSGTNSLSKLLNSVHRVRKEIAIPSAAAVVVVEHGEDEKEQEPATSALPHALPHPN